ncbi:GNAT family N-acetyltransferase [Pararhizobium haloflavum]|uniref:GNAT family N-acetyltransferase n=1 Tax=Pararhizobium haloflavum TaxID=2037914 RepID=UPI000C17B4BC|nr:N-acetyltransferase [Pararhizobium haloflavum]
MDIRDERAGDGDDIRAVTSAAFSTVPYASGTEAAIVDALRAADALTVSLVAVEDGAVVGHAAFSPVTINGRHDGWFGLGPVSVRPDRQRHGIGRQLIGVGLARLETQGARGCVVLGDPAYYARFGFTHDPALTFEGPPPIYFQRLVFSGAAPTGRVAFHPGFDAQ